MCIFIILFPSTKLYTVKFIIYCSVHSGKNIFLLRDFVRSWSEEGVRRSGIYFYLTHPIQVDYSRTSIGSLAYQNWHKYDSFGNSVNFYVRLYSVIFFINGPYWCSCDPDISRNFNEINTLYCRILFFISQIVQGRNFSNSFKLWLKIQFVK